MKRFLVSLLALLAASLPALAQAPNNLNSATVNVGTCGPVTGTITKLGDSVALPCPGASNYLVTMTTPAGQTPLIGTVVSVDSVTGGGRLLFKTGVGPLDIAALPLSGAQSGTLEYRTVGGGNGQAVTATAYTSGQAIVTIVGEFGTSMVFLNSPVHMAEEAAMRRGMAYTVSTGLQTVPVGNTISLMLTNPANSPVRLVIPMNGRILACNNTSSALLPSFVSLPNASVNLPTTIVTPSRRGGVSGTSSATAQAGNAATVPNTVPATTNPTGNPFFGVYSIAQGRTLEPGNSILLYIVGVAIPNGLGATNPSCSINIAYYEETLF